MTHASPKLLAAALFVLVCSSSSIRAAIIVTYPANNGFEVPDLGSGGGAYGYGVINAGQGPLSGTSWTFVGGSGIAANESAFNVHNATNGNSDGTTSTAGQTGFVQGGDGSLTGSMASSFSQSFSIPVRSDITTLTFSEEAHTSPNGVFVYLDGTQINATEIVPISGSTFDTVNLSLGLVGAGTHTLTFVGDNVILGGGDRTTFIDNVSISSVVPEPSTFALAALALFGLAFAARRHRSVE